MKRITLTAIMFICVVLVAPATSNASEVRLADQADCALTHVVRRGDTLFRLGARYGVPWREIQQTNQLRSSVLRIGRALCIPGGTSMTAEILSFTVSNANPKQGDTVTFSWTTRGLDRVHLSHQSQGGWLTNRGQANLPPNGSTTFVFGRDEEYTHVFSLAGDANRVNRSMNVTLQCSRPHFFGVLSGQCPTAAPESARVVYQPFERGYLLWFPPAGDADRGQIYVFETTSSTASGLGLIVADGFIDGQPESDPSIVPPGGRHQPLRGFGKVWRQGYRERLGWALLPESGYTATLQRARANAVDNMMFMTLPDKSVISITSGRQWPAYNWRKL